MLIIACSIGQIFRVCNKVDSSAQENSRTSSLSKDISAGVEGTGSRIGDSGVSLRSSQHVPEVSASADDTSTYAIALARDAVASMKFLLKYYPRMLVFSALPALVVAMTVGSGRAPRRNAVT
jgi:hypothetical protein